jgi:hypothetical protein
MSDLIQLGDADGDARWIGVRRHQALLIIVGLGLVGDWVVRSSSVLVELLLGCALLLGAVPFLDNMTLAEWLVVAARFLCRSRWTLVSASSEEAVTTLRARGSVNVQGFELSHRGRLELSGQDVEKAHELMAYVDAIATSDRTSHVSVHVLSTRDRARTLLTLPEGGQPPEGWTKNEAALRETIGAAAPTNSIWFLERWRYLRGVQGLVRVVRLRDFTAVPDGKALLEKLQQSSDHVTVALHFDVVSGARAQRIAARAVHRTGSDEAASSSVGFRHTARAQRALQRLTQRETLVAGGRALLRIGVYVCVRAPSQRQLNASVNEVLRRAHEAGLRCERGLGRQAIWFCHQLPGGPGW